MSTDPTSNLIWIDCEFTSLDFEHNKIVEIAAVVTNSDLEVLGEPVSCVVHYDKQDLDDLLGEWTNEHFRESGLYGEILESNIALQEAEDIILGYVGQYADFGQSPLCGNSVSQDRRVLYTNMPRLESFLHYRTIDVSTLKELAIRWNPRVVEEVNKVQNHRALDDIYESIEELRHYKQQLIRHD